MTKIQTIITTKATAKLEREIQDELMVEEPEKAIAENIIKNNTTNEKTE